MSAVDGLPGQSAARKVVFLAALMTAASLTLSGFAALKVFDAAIEPEIEKRANLIGRSVRDEVENALQIGIPFNALAGVERYLSRVMEDFSEIERITLVDLNNVVVADVSRKPAEGASDILTRNLQERDKNIIVSPMLSGNTLVGQLVLQIDKNFVSSKMRNILLDVFVLGLIAVLLSFEMVIWTVSNTIGKPIDRVFIVLNEQASGVFRHIIRPDAAGTLMRIARRLSDRAYDLAERGGTSGKLASMHKAYFSDVRFPLFLYSTATEISGAFLPIYARDSSSLSWLSDDMAATAPLVAYLAAIALVSPFSGHIASRIGGRNLFLLSIPVTAMTLIGIGLGHSVVSISLWHGAMALVYALATVACQEYSLGAASKGENAQVMGGYLFVILGGAFCGASLGGVLADRIGIPGTFFFSAGLALASGLLGYFALSAKADRHSVSDGVPARVEPLGSGNILFTPRFLSLLTGVTLPANVGTSVFIWFITPLALEAEGAGFADIGRVMMVYYLVPLLVGPAFARMADGRIGYAPFLVAGLSVSGIALTSLFFWSGFWPIAVAVGVFGLGRSMCDSSHYAQAIHIAETSGLRNARLTGLAGLRIIERLAAIAGLVVAAVFLERVGYVSITVLIGLIMFAGAVVVATVELGSGSRRR